MVNWFVAGFLFATVGCGIWHRSGYCWFTSSGFVVHWMWVAHMDKE